MIMEGDLKLDFDFLGSDPFSGVDPDASKWEMLIDQIVQGNVIPVIGDDILMEEDLRKRIIDRLSNLNGITSNPTTFSELVYDEKFKNRDNIYFLLSRFCTDNADKLKPSKLLERLLRIRYFPFVITTSFFPVVENAMKEIWVGRKVKTMVFSNNPATTRERDEGDIGNEGDLSFPTVYYMFGKACDSAHRYVVTDTDMLAFCSAWLSSESRPPVLSSVLKDKYLLVIGNSYPDWLFRFIWYSMNLTDNTRDPFSRMQGMMVNEKLDDSLIQFLNRIDTFTQKDPKHVVDTIEAKLKQKSQETEKQRFDKPAKGCDVFISYSRSDSIVAEALYNALKDRGLNVWYDKAKLKIGSDWLEQIEQSIETARLFVPILSNNIEKERQVFHVYRQEWNIADKRSGGFGRRYIMPLASSDLDFYSADIPKSFKAANAGYYDEKCIDLGTFADEVLDVINGL